MPIDWSIPKNVHLNTSVRRRLLPNAYRRPAHGLKQESNSQKKMPNKNNVNVIFYSRNDLFIFHSFSFVWEWPFNCVSNGHWKLDFCNICTNSFSIVLHGIKVAFGHKKSLKTKYCRHLAILRVYCFFMILFHFVSSFFHFSIHNA